VSILNIPIATVFFALSGSSFHISIKNVIIVIRERERERERENGEE